MSLAGDLAQPIYIGTKHCTFRSWLDTLEPDDATAVLAAIARKPGDPLYWSGPQLAKRLMEAGFPGSASVIYRHRGEGCRHCDIS